MVYSGHLPNFVFFFLGESSKVNSKKIYKIKLVAFLQDIYLYGGRSAWRDR